MSSLPAPARGEAANSALESRIASCQLVPSARRIAAIACPCAPVGLDAVGGHQGQRQARGRGVGEGHDAHAGGRVGERRDDRRGCRAHLHAGVDGERRVEREHDVEAARRGEVRVRDRGDVERRLGGGRGHDSGCQAEAQPHGEHSGGAAGTGGRSRRGHRIPRQSPGRRSSPGTVCTVRRSGPVSRLAHRRLRDHLIADGSGPPWMRLVQRVFILARARSAVYAG